MTPSVALRCLHAELRHVAHLLNDPARARVTDVGSAFQGHLRPPIPGTRAPIGDPAGDAVAAYASRTLAAAGLLGPRGDLDQLEREQRATEHALAIDLARVNPGLCAAEAGIAALITLTTAAYWTDRDQLEAVEPQTAGPVDRLLGARPDDVRGRVLFDAAMSAWLGLDPAPTPATAVLDLREADPEARLDLGSQRLANVG